MNGRGSKPYRMKCSSDKGRSARRAAELMREIIGMQGSGFYMVEGPWFTLLRVQLPHTPKKVK